MTGKDSDPLSTLDELTEQLDEEKRQHENYAHQIAERMEQLQQRRNEIAKLRQEVAPLISEREKYAQGIKDIHEEERTAEREEKVLENELTERRQRYHGIAQQIKNTEKSREDEISKAEEERQSEIAAINEKYDNRITDVKKTAEAEIAQLQEGRRKMVGPTKEMVRKYKDKKDEHSELAQQRREKEKDLIESTKMISACLGQIEEHRKYIKDNSLENFLKSIRPKDMALDPAPSDEEIVQLYDGDPAGIPEDMQLPEPETIRSGTGLEGLDIMDYKPEGAAEEADADTDSLEELEQQLDEEDDEDVSFLNIDDADLDAVVDIPHEEDHGEMNTLLDEISDEHKALVETAAQNSLGPENGKKQASAGSYSVQNPEQKEDVGDVIYLDDGKEKQAKDSAVIGKMGIKRVPDKSKELHEGASDLEKAVADIHGWRYSTERGLGRASIQYTGQGEDKEPHRMIECFDMSLISLMLDSAEKMLNEAAKFPEVIDEENVVLNEDNIDYLSKKSEEFKTSYVALTGTVETVIRLYAPQLNKVISEYMKHEEDMDDSILDDAELDREKSMMLHPEMTRKLEQTILKDILNEHQVKNMFLANLVDVSEGPQYLSEIELNRLVSDLRDTKKYLEATMTQEEWEKAVSGVAYAFTQKGCEIITP